MNANLAHADLSHSVLNFADLESADLSHADLTNAVLWGPDLGNADLSEATLTGVSSQRIQGTPTALPAGWQLSDGTLIPPSTS